jgi:TolB-like protein/Flp pilus assembly protein TadD
VIVTAFDAGDAGDPVAGLCRAIRDEVVSGLSRFRDLGVITDPRRPEAVRAEGMTDRSRIYVLGSTFRASPEGVRVTVQLIRVGDRYVIWSDRLALPHANVVETTERIIAQVIGAVLPNIHADLSNLAQMPANAAYERYLIAREAAAQACSHEDARAAAEALERLIADEPAFVLPYLPLARLYNTDFGYTRALSSGAGERERAFQLTKAALAKDRRHVDGYSVMGWSYLLRRQWDSARAHFDQAIALNPFHAERVMEVGFGFLFLGEIETARQLLDRCLMLNPEPRDEFFTGLGLLEVMRGDFDRASSYFELVARRTVWNALYAAVNARLGGMAHAAKAEAARHCLQAIWPDSEPMTEATVLGWIRSHTPFRLESDLQRFLAEARQVLLPRASGPGRHPPESRAGSHHLGRPSADRRVGSDGPGKTMTFPPVSMQSP